jgi:hypothetical protein
MSAKIIIPKCFAKYADEPRWVVWRHETVKPGKPPTKVPYRPADTSRKASSTDPTTWTDAKTAVAVLERSFGYFDGVMFALTDLPLVAFDLDDCIINGELHEWAQQLIARCSETYVETTPSGTSLRVIGTGDGPCLDKKYAVGDDVSCEIYRKPTGRFITITGKRYNNAPDVLTDLNSLADTVKAELETAKQEAKQAKQRKLKLDGGGKKKDMPPLEDVIKDGHFGRWGNDRSRAEYYVVNELIRLGKSDEDIIAVFSDANNGIAAHCLSKPEKPRDYIMRTIARARAEAGGATADGSPDPAGAEIAKLAALSDIEYERERADAAKRLGVRAPILDRLVQAERDRKRRASGDDDCKLQGRALKLDEPKAWDKEVNGVELLDAIAKTIRDYVILEEWQARTIAVWVLHTYLVDSFQFSPRLCITSPTKACGKTTLLDTVSALVLRALSTANISTSATFRVIEMCRPTLTIDEADNFVDTNNELRGILNSGHRKGGAVLRVVGDDLEPRQFSTFGACAIALIGALPSTLADRSITIELKRKRAGEKAKPFRLDQVEPLKILARQCQRWAQDHAIEVGADANLPPEIFNRAADNWRVLKQIAVVAGGEWPDHIDNAARVAATAVSDEELLVQLLADIRAIEFSYIIGDDNGTGYSADDEIPSAALVQKLVELQGRPWAELPDNGKALTANKLARMLKPLAIAPDFIGPEDARARGYRREHFQEAFARYLSELGEDGGLQPCSRAEARQMGISDISEACSPDDACTVEKREKPNNGGVLHGCTVQKRGQAGSGANGGDKGLEPDLIERLAREYYERFLADRDEEAGDVALRRQLAGYDVFPEYIKTEFDRVKAAVNAL